MNQRLLSQLKAAQSDWSSGAVCGRESGWELDPAARTNPAISKFASEYLTSLNNKTVPDRIRFLIKKLRSAGFQEYSELTKSPIESAFRDKKKPKVKAGSKFYFIVEGNMLAAVETGTKSLEQGMVLTAAHIDSVNIVGSHVAVKQNYNLGFVPCSPRGGLEIRDWYGQGLEFHYHGLISGRGASREGTVVIGSKSHEPKFSLIEESAHFSDNIKPRISDMIVAMGSVPIDDPSIGREKSIAAGVYAQLFKKYGLTPEDLAEGEIIFVPAQKPHFGDLEQSLIVGYGQDNWISAYSVLRGLTDSAPSPYTKTAVFYDREEIGDDGPGGLRTRILENYVLPVIVNLDGMNLDKQWAYPKRSLSLFCDASEAINAHNPGAHDANESAYLGSGVIVSKSGGDPKDYDGHIAKPAHIRGFRNLLRTHNLPSQLAIMGNRDNRATSASTAFHPDLFRSLDIGVPLSGMHKAAEKTSVIDLWNFYRTIQVVNSSQDLEAYFPAERHSRRAK